MLRYLVVAALALLSWITYLDRAAISSVKDPIRAELGFDDKAMGAVFSAFALGEIPAGWGAAGFGPRLLLTVVVALWSLLTGFTGLVQTFMALLVVRFLFGLAEAGAYPGTVRAFYTWLPSWEHGREWRRFRRLEPLRRAALARARREREQQLTRALTEYEKMNSAKRPGYKQGQQTADRSQHLRPRCTTHETFSLTLRAELQRASLDRYCCGDCRRNRYYADSSRLRTSVASDAADRTAWVRDQHR